jgi:anti-sigma regulatory factor (Ser/Thr protein kinase)
MNDRKKPFAGEMRAQINRAAISEALPEIIEFVCSYARDMAFGEKRTEDLGLALEETLGNILRFACPQGTEEISVTCDANDMGALLVNIVDSGVPFNMLVMSAFPETVGDPQRQAGLPPTKAMKRAVKDIEYRRDGERKTNILAWVVWK